MCENATKSEIDRDDIGWKCRIRNDFGQDSFSLKTSANEAGNESSVQYDLKYDGIFDLKNIIFIDFLIRGDFFNLLSFISLADTFTLLINEKRGIND